MIRLHNLKIASLNVNGLRNPVKRSKMLEQTNKQHLSAALVSLDVEKAFDRV